MDGLWSTHQGLVCPVAQRVRYEGWEDPASAAGPAADLDPETGIPRRFDRPTLLIWHSKTCQACRLSEGVFRALERTAGDGLRVVRVPAAWDLLRRRYTHVTTLPTYDLVQPAAPHEVAPGYGPGVRLRSIPGNDLPTLRRVFPAAFSAEGGAAEGGRKKGETWKES